MLQGFCCPRGYLRDAERCARMPERRGRLQGRRSLMHMRERETMPYIVHLIASRRLQTRLCAEVCGREPSTQLAHGQRSNSSCRRSGGSEHGWWMSGCAWRQVVQCLVLSSRARQTQTQIPHTTGNRLVRGSGDGWAYPVSKRVSPLCRKGL
jgi:hypothetical protein